MPGHTYRDLNKNGRLDPYEDSRLPVEERVADLLGQLSLEEKVGLMFHVMIGMNPDGTIQDGLGNFGASDAALLEVAEDHFQQRGQTAP